MVTVHGEAVGHPWVCADAPGCCSLQVAVQVAEGEWLTAIKIHLGIKRWGKRPQTHWRAECPSAAEQGPPVSQLLLVSSLLKAQCADMKMGCWKPKGVIGSVPSSLLTALISWTDLMLVRWWQWWPWLHERIPLEILKAPNAEVSIFSQFFQH